MSTPDRNQVIRAFRLILDAVEPHPDLPLPVMGSSRVIFQLHGTVAPQHMAALEAALPCEFASEVSESDNYYRLKGEISGVSVVISAPAESVAERRVTGTRTVEDVEWVRLPAEDETSGGGNSSEGDQ